MSNSLAFPPPFLHSLATAITPPPPPSPFPSRAPRTHRHRTTSVPPPFPTSDPGLAVSSPHPSESRFDNENLEFDPIA
ncbi:hypothetical protein AKJ16_DCAP18307 [Drosera capensis]